MSRFIDRAELFNRLSSVKTLAEAYAVVQEMPAAETKNVPDTNVGDMISRQAAIDALDAICDRECEYTKKQRAVMCASCHLGSAFDVIDELPSAERHGRWGGRPIAGYTTVRCSICGAAYTENSGRWLYCPNCGASMMDDNATQHTERVENALGALDEMEVKRCGECKHYDRRMDVCHNPRWGDGWANYPPPSVNEDFFCADGAKTDEVTK